MPLLPIPACMESLGGMDLKEGMMAICVAVIILSLLPILLVIVFCNVYGGGFNTDADSTTLLPDASTQDGATEIDPVGFATGLAIIIAVLVLICLFVEEIPSIIHFILIIVWLIVLIFVVGAAIYAFQHQSKSLFKGTCGLILFINLIMYLLLAVAMIVGLLVYWSFYAESD